ncbi:hypothetical protein I2I11_20700, partial [Pontibacter sp. 172403-2]|uniref:hypothetical protein n=1 Tax=Pontibacter rufus TaxID=2791028 RepID=UPI0018B009BD
MMKKSFIFSFIREISVPLQGTKKANHLVLFFPYKAVLKDQADIQVQLREYFYRNTIPDKIIIIGLEFNRNELLELFESESEIYRYIPHYDVEQNKDDISGIYISSQGTLESFLGKKLKDDLVREIFNRGMTKIFNDNGGLIISKSAHHFVFPSGKHSDKFLRAGNVLIHGTQIMYLASALIIYLAGKRYNHIYCDTSSINSLAYSYIYLLKDLDPTYGDSIHVESFGSYKMFEESTFEAKRDSLFLISSSTSGGIVKRMVEDRKKNIEVENIAIVYGLDVEAYYKRQVICDLTNHKDLNPQGLVPFKSYNVNRGQKCELCIGGSTAVEVKGDVFLLEKPVVNGQLIHITDVPPFLNKLGAFYSKGSQEDSSIIRCYYKEGQDHQKKYDIYIDIDTVLNEWETNVGSTHRFQEIFDKIEKYVVQNIPASLKFMIALPDQASFKLAKLISTILRKHGLNFNDDNILGINDLESIDKSIEGTIAVISSSTVSGRNFLYLSRALRVCFELEKSGNRPKLEVTKPISLWK